MSSNNAKQIEKLIKATVAQEKASGPTYFGSSPEPLVQKSAVPESIIKAKDKIQPSKIQPSKLEEGSGVKSPLTQSGPAQVYEDALHVDSSGVLTLVYKPLKSLPFTTADGKDFVLNFTDVVRPPIAT